MGDVAVGARSGHDGPEGQPERPDDAAAPAVEGASGSGSESADGSATTERTEQDPKKKQRSFWKELPILIGIALVLALLIKTFLVQAFSIPSDSMQNTLQQGDRVLVDKLTPWFGSEPERGEVVVFHDPDGWLRASPRPTRTPCRRCSAGSA